MAPPRFKAPALKLLSMRSGFLCGLDWAYGTSAVQMLLTSACSRRADPAFELLLCARDWAKGTSRLGQGHLLVSDAPDQRAITPRLPPAFGLLFFEV